MESVIGSSSREKDLWVLVCETGKVNWQPTKPTTSWAASKAVYPAGEGREFCPSVLLWWDPTIQLQGSKYRKDTDLLKQVQRRDRKVIKGLPSNKAIL